MMPPVDLASIDLYGKIAALNPDYVDAVESVTPFAARINKLCFAALDRRLYLIFADAYVFFSDDGLRSLHEVREINYDGAGLVPVDRQAIDAAVETLDGTVLFAGRDRREPPAPSPAGAGQTEAGIVWRKPRAAAAFTRSVVSRPGWSTSKSSNAAAGFLGARHAKAVALSIYGTEDAHFYYSLDDGLTWRRQAMAEYFYHHVHELYLPRSVPGTRAARLWVTGGDDPSGTRSGVVCFEGVDEDGNLQGAARVMREMPGYRYVGINGNGKHVFIGNESLAGGVVKVQDNRESIDVGDFEYVLGKARHEYHQCGSLVATPDGLLVSGTSSYSMHTGDTVRGDSGGCVYVSNNEGATFVEIPLGAKWVTSIAYDGECFWIAASASREYGPDVSNDRFRLLKLSKPSPYRELAAPFVSKVLILDSSTFYATFGYPSHPQPVLAPGEKTMRVDLSGYRTVVLDVETLGPGRLVIEALPFYTWRLSENPWRDVQVVAFEGPERREVLLPEGASHNRYFRVRNDGSHPLGVKLLAFLGRK